MKFVIQEHRAGQRVRYYLRLERDGLLKSWALPKGMPKEWGVQRLALQVGDGDLSLVEFQDKVQKGRFGPGEIKAWDSGEYECHRWEAGKIIFTLNGSRVRGSYALVLFPRGGEKSWLLGETRGRTGVVSGRAGDPEFKSSAGGITPKSTPRRNVRFFGAGRERWMRRWKGKVKYPSMRRMSIFRWEKRDFRLVLWIAVAVALGYGVVSFLKWLF